MEHMRASDNMNNILENYINNHLGLFAGRVGWYNFRSKVRRNL